MEFYDKTFLEENGTLTVDKDVTTWAPNEAWEPNLRLSSKTSELLFPEATLNLEAATDLKAALEELQRQALERDDKLRGPQDVELTKAIQQFGVPRQHIQMVKEILAHYMNICRTLNAEGKVFKPGVQYNYQGVSEEGLDVTFGNYGLFLATAGQAAKDQGYKNRLTRAGRQWTNNPAAFVHNPPAFNTVVTTTDLQLLAAHRGATAEYADMLHSAAAGHHPVNGRLIVSYEEILNKQLELELGLPFDERTVHTPLGLAWSAGKNIKGTEKPEAIFRTSVPFTESQVRGHLEESAAHRWETKQLIAVHIAHAQMLLDEEEGQAFGSDPNSVDHWVPVGRAALIQALEQA